MRTGVQSLAAGVFFSVLIAAQQPAEQNVERLLRFTNTETAEQLQEVGTVVRSIAEIRHAFVDIAARTLTLRGTAEQMPMAEWLFYELDKHPRPETKPLTQEYRITGNSSENLIRVFYLNNAPTVQQLQEITTTLRSIIEIRRAFTYNGPRAMILRATPDQIAMAEWLVAKLDRPVGEPAAPGETYTVRHSTDDVMRVFYLKNADTIRKHQEVSTVLRSITEIRRAFTYNTLRAVALRGTADQIAMAEWLIDKLDRPLPEETRSQQTNNADAPPYRIAGSDDDVVRVFYLPRDEPLQRFTETAVAIRQTAALRRAFTYKSHRVLAVRGTADQIATAERFLRDRPTP